VIDSKRLVRSVTAHWTNSYCDQCFTATAFLVVIAPTRINRLQLLLLYWRNRNITPIVVTMAQLFFGSNSTLTVNDNGTTQTFQIIVRDANGCLSPVQTITLAPLNRPTDLAFANAAVTCTATTATVSVTATNGVGALTFLITGTTSATAASNFWTGNYRRIISSGRLPNLLPEIMPLGNRCQWLFLLSVYTIAPVAPIAIAGNKTSDVLCREDLQVQNLYRFRKCYCRCVHFVLTSDIRNINTIRKYINLS
jgi:hypothetical protein